jgi:hypothetical protein
MQFARLYSELDKNCLLQQDRAAGRGPFAPTPRLKLSKEQKAKLRYSHSISSFCTLLGLARHTTAQAVFSSDDGAELVAIRVEHRRASGGAGSVLFVRGQLYHGPERPAAENPLPARSLIDR